MSHEQGEGGGARRIMRLFCLLSYPRARTREYFIYSPGNQWRDCGRNVIFMHNGFMLSGGLNSFTPKLYLFFSHNSLCSFISILVIQNRF